MGGTLSQAFASLLVRLLPAGDREALLGDLLEKQHQRSGASSGTGCGIWPDLIASLLPLLWWRITQGRWLAVCGMALAGYAAVGITQALVAMLIPSSLPPHYNPAGLLVTFPAVALIACAAERRQRHAAILLAAMMLAVITGLSLVTTEAAPLWYRVAWFFLGPLAALTGRALAITRRPSGPQE